MCMCICVCVYVNMCMCVCEYVHLYMCTRVEPVLTLRPFHWLTLNRSLLHWSLLTNQYFRVTTRSFIIRYADMYALGLVSLSFMILHVCIYIYIYMCINIRLPSHLSCLLHSQGERVSLTKIQTIYCHEGETVGLCFE